MQGCFVLEWAWRRGSGDIASCTCGTASVSPGSACWPLCQLGRGASEEAAPDAWVQLSWALHPPGAAQKLHQGLFQKNNLSGRYFTYINIHLYGYVQMQQQPSKQRGSCPETLPLKRWLKPSSLGNAMGILGHAGPREALAPAAL